MPERICSRTGLWLVPAPMIGFRVASESRGALDPKSRGNSPRSGWNRYDTLGSTIYLAETPTIAFMEVLSAFQLRMGDGSSLERDATALGITIRLFLAEIAADWDEQQFFKIGYLPPEWANKRLIFRVQLTGAGWWVDVENPESLLAIRNALGDDLRRETGLHHLNTSILRSDDRDVTTRIAGWIRNQVLDDGTVPHGICFGSKHGGGRNWAYWLRRRDDGLGEDPIVADMGSAIDSTTSGFANARRLLNLKD